MKNNIANASIESVLGKTVYLKTYDERGAVIPIPARRKVTAIKLNKDHMAAEVLNERMDKKEIYPLENLSLNKDEVQDDILIELARTKMRDINMEYYEKEDGLKMTTSVNFALTDWTVEGKVSQASHQLNTIEDVKKITGNQDNATASITISGTFIGRYVSLPVGDWNIVANVWHDGNELNDPFNNPCGFLHLRA